MGAELGLKPKLRNDFANGGCRLTAGFECGAVENRPHFNETMQIQRAWIAPHERTPGEFDRTVLRNALERGRCELQRALHLVEADVAMFGIVHDTDQRLHEATQARITRQPGQERCRVAQLLGDLGHLVGRKKQQAIATEERTVELIPDGAKKIRFFG